MILVLIPIAIFSAGAVWYLRKISEYTFKLCGEQAVTNGYLKDLWLYYENAAKEQVDTNKKLDELVALFRTTFTEKYAAKLDDVINIKKNMPETVKVLCDDGKYHDLPVDEGF